MIRKICMFVVGIFFIACTTTDKKDIGGWIAKHYTIEEINFFYEMCFNHPKGQSRLINKWSTDIYFGFEGEFTAEDSLIMHELAEKVNTLDLSIKIFPATGKHSPNLIIFSDSDSTIKYESNLLGITHKYGPENSMTIDSARIILSKKRMDMPEYLKLLYWHEFLHALGFSSHITTRTDCILTSNMQSTSSITINHMEEQALRMLYEPIWSEPYSREDFEKDFANQLYFMDGVQKIATSAKYCHLSVDLLTNLLEHSLVRCDSTIEPQIIKFSMPLNVKFKGDVPEAMKDTLMFIIDELNSIGSTIRLAYSEDTLTNSGMIIRFNRDMEGVKGHGALNNFYMARNRYGYFITNHLSSITINYHPNGSLTDALGAVVYQVLIGSREEQTYNLQPFTFEEGQLHLKPYYRNLLQVYYSPHLPHNFTKSQLEEVMQLMAADSISAAKQQ